MAPTTRRSTGRLPPPSIPFGAVSAPPPQVPAPILGGTMALGHAFIPAAASIQPVGVLTRMSTRRGPAAAQALSFANVTSALPQEPGSPILGDGDFFNKSRASTAVSQTVNTPSRAVSTSSNQSLRSIIDSVNSRPALVSASAGPPSRQAGTPVIPHMNVTTLKDIEDLNLRQRVNSLNILHPWASVSLCHSMLLRFQAFPNADYTLQTMGGMEVPDKINPPRLLPLLWKPNAPASISSSSDSTGIPQLPQPQRPVPVGEDPDKPISMQSSSKRKNAEATIEPGQQFLSFSKPDSSTAGIFSRAKRQRAIAASTETAADRKRASFVANAVLYKAFSTEAGARNRVTKTFVPQHGFKAFPIVPGPVALPPSDKNPLIPTYKDTDRGKFQTLSFDTPEDGHVVLQSISLVDPYLRTSFEELRFGDYLKGRKKAPHLFDLFHKLPTEVRCMIWRFAMPSRTIELRHNPHINKLWTPTKVPILLQVSQESRYEALKRYTLAFGIGNAQSKIYFDFKRDTLFFTYEKWYGEADYEGEVSEMTVSLVVSGDARKVQHLAIDKDLLDILARILEDEEEEWYDEGDNDVPMPVIDVIPLYTSLRTLAIVKTAIDGFWYPDDVGCEGDHDGKECDIHKRSKKNDNAVILPSPAYHIAHPNREYYKEMIVKIKDLNGDTWELPELEYMAKHPFNDKTLKIQHPREGCSCGNCFYDSD